METLGQYFSYNNDPEKIREAFLSLDNQLKIIHQRGYYVDISSTSIVYENGLSFTSFNKGLSEEKRRANIVDLTKLAVGTYFSIPSGTFSDYTRLPDNYLRDNFEAMESSIFKANLDDNYYRDVLINGHVGYYCDYLKNLKSKPSQGKGNTSSRVLGYSTPEGRAMANKDDAAFIDLAFYPVIATLLAIVSYAIYILVK